VPRDGRYVRAPALSDETGVVSVPPRVPDPFPLLLGLGLAAAVGLYLGTRVRRSRARRESWESEDDWDDFGRPKASGSEWEEIGADEWEETLA
jgi:hypothetical protein